jgi:CheY-like chemotaxis protein
MDPSDAAVGPYIVCVDDDPSLLQLFAEVFRVGLAASVGTATCAAEAQALLQVGPVPDLVLIVYTMPGMTGLDLIRWARTLPRLAAVPLIIFTAVDSLSPEEARAAGATDYLVKPLPPRALVSRLRPHLRRP